MFSIQIFTGDMSKNKKRTFLVANIKSLEVLRFCEHRSGIHIIILLRSFGFEICSGKCNLHGGIRCICLTLLTSNCSMEAAVFIDLLSKKQINIKDVCKCLSVPIGNQKVNCNVTFYYFSQNYNTLCIVSIFITIKQLHVFLFLN